MSKRQYIFLMILGTIVAGIGFTLAIFLINPELTSNVGFIFFYASIFLFSLGGLSVTGLAIRSWLFHHELEIQQVTHALRQSFFLSSMFIISLFLQSKELFTVTNIIILFVIIIVLELLCLSQTTPTKPHDL